MPIIEMKVPVIGESITEVTLSAWLKGNGEYVELDEPICEFESDKATLEFPAEAAGTLIHVAAEEDDLEIGALVARIDTSGIKESTGASEVSEKPKETQSNQEPATEPANENYATGHPSPAAAKILTEKGLSADQVKGTGKDGRITKEDAVKAQVSKPVSSADAPVETPKVTTLFSRGEERKKLSRMRRTIAKRLVSAKNSTAMLTTFNEADMSAIIKMRKQYQEQFVEKFGVKLGFMSIFSKACAKVLLEMPDVNAFLDNDHVIYHDYVDISIAISTPNGLVVPPLKNVESMSFAEIENEIKRLAGKARDGSLTLDEMSGGTFTITNGGIFGSLLSTPIINEPQSAILGLHAIKQRPVAVDGKVEIRPMMYLALSYDHRIIDGSTSVTFLKRVVDLLEDPVSLMLL